MDKVNRKALREAWEASCAWWMDVLKEWKDEMARTPIAFVVRAPGWSARMDTKIEARTALLRDRRASCLGVMRDGSRRDVTRAVLG